MIAIRLWFTFFICSLILACGFKTGKKVFDPHSFATPDKAKVVHADLDLNVDFDRERIGGMVVLEIDHQDKPATLVLDTRKLTIEDVKISADSTNLSEADWKLGIRDSILGRPLRIKLKGDTRYVHVQYHSESGAEALQFLPPSLTASKTSPYLLTQSQAINARSWLPIQDSPGIRFTYRAKLQVPPGLMAVMSATNPTEKSPDGRYTFAMEEPIPAYLLALAVGDFAFAPLGERTGVYAELPLLEKGIHEFAEMEQMLEIAESLYGPYRWERYDVIILPPSFPFGGMENPRITFLTPTILAGDRSLVSLIAHELAHSWSGNLVTNANWNDFWLNEGFTVYVEYRIMEALKGREYAEMLAQISYQDLVNEVAELGPENPDTQLKADLGGRNPDDGVSAVAYDKGYYFLRLVEETTGRENFDAFLREYFDDHSFETMTTEGFLDVLDKKLLSKNPEWAKTINVDGWIYASGIPDNIPVAQSKRFDQVEDQLNAFLAGTPASELQTEKWSAHEWQFFLRKLPVGMSAAQMEQLDQAFGLSKSGNSEVLCQWFIKSVKNNYTKAYPNLRRFLIDVGRRKFLSPIYRALLENPETRDLATDIYAEARSNYHPISYQSIDEIFANHQEG